VVARGGSASHPIAHGQTPVVRETCGEEGGGPGFTSWGAGKAPSTSACGPRLGYVLCCHFRKPKTRWAAVVLKGYDKKPGEGLGFLSGLCKKGQRQTNRPGLSGFWKAPEAKFFIRLAGFYRCPNTALWGRAFHFSKLILGAQFR